MADDESVLQAARREGVWLPADCQQGWCTSYAARLLEGEVDQSVARRYFEEDEAAGFVLTRIAKPRLDLRLEVCRHEEILDHRAKHDKPPGNVKR